VYHGAASACAAAFQGRPDLWPAAEADLSTEAPHEGVLDCIDSAAYHFMQTLVEAHRSLPTATLKRRPGKPGGPCPGILSVLPDKGSAAGGYQLRIIGANLPPQARIAFGDHHYVVTTSDGRDAVLTAPPAPPGQLPMTVTVTSDDTPYSGKNFATFVYEAPAARGDVSTQSGSPSLPALTPTAAR
jgi:hypothetical protein